MGCCCSSDEMKKNMLINKLFIDEDIGPYNRSLLEELGTCSFCKTDGISVIYRWIGRDYMYICEYCELEIDKVGIVAKLREIM